MQVKVLRDGNLIAVKGLNVRLANALQRELQYTKMIQIRGADLAESHGQRQRFENVRLYEYDANKRLLTNFGFRERVTAVLQRAGAEVLYTDLRPPTPQQLRRRRVLRERLEDFTFRYQQDEVIEQMLQHDNGIFVCPTGWGKSFIMRVLAGILPQAKIHIITKSADVIRGHYQELLPVLPDVGLQGAGYRINDRRVQLYCAGSLLHSDFDADYVLVDEGHEMATPSLMPLLARYRFSKLFMFTASYEKRLDKADKELEGLFGPVRTRVSYQEGVAHKMIVPIRVRCIPVLMDEDPAEGYENTAKERHAIWRNAFRNQLIRDVALEFDAEEQVLIVCEKVEHAVRLKKLLPGFTLCYGETGMKLALRAKYLRQGWIAADEPVMTPQRRIWLKEEFAQGRLKKVIATSVWNRGVDFRQLSVLIRADASGSPINDDQIPGRVSRLHVDKQEGLLIDFMDQFNKTYKGRFEKRRRSYAANGWTLELPQVNKHSNRNHLLF